MNELKYNFDKTYSNHSLSLEQAENMTYIFSISSDVFVDLPKALVS